MEKVSLVDSTTRDLMLTVINVGILLKEVFNVLIINS